MIIEPCGPGRLSEKEWFIHKLTIEIVQNVRLCFCVILSWMSVFYFELHSERQQRICLPSKRRGFDPWVRKIPWRREWQPTPVFLPGESHGQRSLVSYSPRGLKESDTTEWITHTHTVEMSVHFWAKTVKVKKYGF